MFLTIILAANAGIDEHGHGSIKQNMADAAKSKELLWMDEILHHFQAMGSHCWISSGGSVVRNGFRPTVGILSMLHAGELLGYIREAAAP